jgi:hypothetical protein
MYARVTLLTIDTERVAVSDAVAEVQRHTLPLLRAQPGYRGIYVLATPEGKGMLVSLWETEDQAAIDSVGGFYSDELAHFTTMFRSPPGRDRYEVVLTDTALEDASDRKPDTEVMSR